MTRPLTLASAVLAAALLLASCNSAPSTGSPSTGNSGGSSMGSGSAVMVSRTVTLGLPETPDAELLVPATLASRVQAEVISVPGGLIVSAGTPTQQSSGNTTIPLSVSGSAAAGQLVKVKVTVGSSVTTTELPVVSFTAQTIQATGLSGSYIASNLRFQPGGTLTLTSALSGDQAARQSVLQRQLDGTFTRLSFPAITAFGEAITSQTSTPDGTLWVTVRGVTKEGSYLLSRDPAGNMKKYAVDAAGDTVNNATATPDGRVWFTQYTQSALKTLSAASGSVQKFSVPEKADSLVYGADGNLYYSSFYAHPAIVQVNPESGSTRTFNVGEANRSQATAVTPAPDGSVWFIEATTSTVNQLDPKTGQQSVLTLPVDVHPNALAISPGGQLWISDATNARLYTTDRTSSGTQTLMGMGTPSGGAHALNIDSQGKVWFEAGGKLYAQQ